MSAAFQYGAFQFGAFQEVSAIFQVGSHGHKHNDLLWEKYPDFEEQYAYDAIAILLLSD